MRCLVRTRELPKKCPKCGKRLKKEKCQCGHVVCQEESNQEKAWMRRSYDEVPYFW